MFIETLIPRCVEKNIFGTKCESRVRIPIEFKILIALRILARGNFVNLLTNSQILMSIALQEKLMR